MDNKKKEEKERLMKEVLSKRRDFSTNLIDASNVSLQKLNDELEKTKTITKDNQEQLGQMVQELQQELNQTYDVPVDVNQQLFLEIEEEVNRVVYGQIPAVREMGIGFYRPFLKENQNSTPVMLVCGPSGSGRHFALKEFVRQLHIKNVFSSGKIHTINMETYQSGAQENIFVQDIYAALNQEGNVICVENFERGFPPFLRMLESLILTGEMPLSKRYVENKSALVETQTGLVKKGIDKLSANGKYIVLMNENGMNGVQKVFGVKLNEELKDVIQFDQVDETSTKRIIHEEISKIKNEIAMTLKLDVIFSSDVETWIYEHYDKNYGIDDILQIMRKIYRSVSQVVLDKQSEIHNASILVENDVPMMKQLDGTSVVLFQKNVQDLQIEKELDEVIGLQQVKTYIKSLKNHMDMQILRRQQGFQMMSISKHMIFTGNPGTGKTMIARLLAHYLKAIGALSQGQLIEVTRKDLVAQYVGQTAPLTMSVIKSAIGGVLFIDEAYALNRGLQDSFGLEAIDTIVKAMEDYRDDLVVVLAGYQKEMEEFLESNSGLRSRFANIIHFDDYTGEELFMIAEKIVSEKGYRLDEGVKIPLTQYFTNIQSTQAESAGNGRLARNIVEKAILNQATRNMEQENKELDLLRIEDFDLNHSAF